MFKIVLKTLVVFAVILAFSFPVSGDDGMWMPHQMKDLNLAAKGLKMNPEDLYKKDGSGLMSAVVYLGGGTGEFVSSKGLMLTNHHVAFGAIQRASDKDHDYIRKGFLAPTFADEIPAPGYIADVLLGYDDVTKDVLRVLKPRMTPMQRSKAIEKITKKLIAKEEKKAKDRRAMIRSMYSGNAYYLYKFKRLPDVRIAYAPPQSIGNFGGEIDNWMWPRHTGDFTFLRVYVGKDNVGAPYSKDNVPYEPKVFLKPSIDGLEDGDFTFVMGYPGRTYRNYTLAELNSSIKQLKERLSLFREMLGFFEKAGEGDRAIQIKYARTVKGLHNGRKNYEGKLEGLGKTDIIDRKKASEAKFLAWVKEDPAREKKYGAVLTKLADFIERNESFNRKSQLVQGMVGRRGSSALLGQGYLIYRTVMENQKPDMKRDNGFQKRDLPRIKMRIELAERGYHLETDKTYFKFVLKRLLDKYPADQWPAALKPVLSKGADAIGKYVDECYAGTILTDPKKRLSLIKLKPAKLMKLKDPFIALAAELEKEAKTLREKGRAMRQEQQDLKKYYMEAVLAMRNNAIAPDANSSIRFTYGNIEGYRPKDAVVYTPFTTLKGVLEKETGKLPFMVPDKLKKLHKAGDFGRYADKNLGDVVTCFLNTTNVTGGNSGSPVLNAKGEQVGIVFDMTYESVTGDYYVIPELQRTIHVDIRYVLFVTEKFGGALHLIKEMGL